MKKGKIRQLLTEILDEVRKPAPPATGVIKDQSLTLYERGAYVIAVRVEVAGKTIGYQVQHASAIDRGEYAISARLEVVRIR